MLPHQERVVNEKAELDVKIEALSGFVMKPNPHFDTAPQDEQKRLVRQLNIMREYSEVLGERITAFK